MKNIMKKQLTFGFTLLLALGTLAGCSTNSTITPKNPDTQTSGGGAPITQNSTSKTVDTDKDGLPDNAEIVL